MDELPLNAPLTQEQQEIAFRTIAKHDRWKDWEIADTQLKEVIGTLKQPLLRELIDRVFQNCSNPENKPRWGDKTPPYVKEIDRLHQVFPKAKFIHLIRDGRDVCLSLANTKWHGVAIEKQAAYWCEMVNAGIESGRKLGEDLYIEVKYEDLVLKSEETLHRICKFLGEEYDSRMLEYYQSADRELTAYQKEKQIHDNTKLPPQVSKVYKWPREMRPIGVAMFEAIAGSTMDRVGQGRMFRGPLRIISWGYKLAVDLAVQTRTIRKRWGLQIPYHLLRKFGLAGEGIYKEKK